MTKITLDTNVIVSLEENRASAPVIKELIELHNKGEVKLGVVAISGSERNREGTYPKNYNEFQNKLENVGLENVDILIPMEYWDICFWDHGLWSDDQMEKLEREIHEILFPNIEFDFQKYCEKNSINLNDTNTKQYRKWRNAKCDVQMIWAHIYFKRDVFITEDDNFRKKSKIEELLRLGAGKILEPQNTLQYVNNISN